MEPMKIDDAEERINHTDDNEIKLLSERFKVSEVSIRAAVQAVGTRLEDIKNYLQKMDEKFQHKR